MAAPLINVLRQKLINISLRSCRSFHTHEHRLNAADLLKQSASQYRALCRTSQVDPGEHGVNQQGLYYTVPEEYAKKFFNTGQREHLKRMFRAFTETSVMVRKPALEVINCLKEANYDFPAIRYILYGPRGAGKTVTLAHIMHYCAVNDWLILHIPWVPVLTRHVEDYMVSSYKPDKVDFQAECIEWMNYFLNMNADFLKNHNPTIEGEYTWTKRDKALPGTPWQQVINFATERPKSANDVMNVILKEIKQQACQKKFKVLVAVDGVNNMWETTLIKRDDDRHQKYHPDDLSMIYNFKKLMKNDWTNGAVVGVADSRAANPGNDQSDMPLYLLKEEGNEFFDPFLPIYVGNYSDKEMYSNLEYFLDRKWIQNPAALTEEGRKEIIFLSCKNPMELYKVTQPW